MDDIQEKEQSLNKVLALMKGNKPAAAAKVCREYLGVSPGCIDHLRMLSHAAGKLNLLDEAKESITFAIELRPGFAPLHEDLGALLVSEGRLTLAIESFEKAIRLDPTRPTAHKRLGQALAAAGRGDEADDAFEAFFEKDPGKGAVAVGAEHYRAGRLDQAIDILREALRVAPDNVDEITADGQVNVDNTFTRDPNQPVMPRVGMNVELARSLDQVEWFGRGPHENYSDRNESANVGRYTNTVADHYVPYMRPQENGYKTGVRWLSLSDADNGLLVRANGLISFGVSHNRLIDFVPPVKIAITSEDGEGARVNNERVNVHVNDIKPRDLISLDIDLGQMGVGGDDSWGKRTLQKYSLSKSEYHYGFSLLPYSNEEGGLDAIVQR